MPNAHDLANGFKTHAEAARWLVKHGIHSESTPKTWPMWRDTPLTPEAILAKAISLQDPNNHRVTWRLHRCDDLGCVCRELL